jgi:hypothetical protein
VTNIIIVHRPDGVAVEIPYDPEQIQTPEFPDSVRDAVMESLSFVWRQPDTAEVSD